MSCCDHVLPWFEEWKSSRRFPLGSSFLSSFVASTYTAYRFPPRPTATVGQLVVESCAWYEPTRYRFHEWPSFAET